MEAEFLKNKFSLEVARIEKKQNELQDIISFEKDDSIEEKETSMTKEELTQIRESLSLTKKEFAEKIGTTAMIVGRYESGNLTIPEAVSTAAKELVEPVDASILIKNVREKLSLSKSALAEMIGVSETTIRNYESGKRKPKDDVIAKIKDLMNNAAPVGEGEEKPAPIGEEEKPAPADEKGVAIPADEKDVVAPVGEKGVVAPVEEEAEKPIKAERNIPITIESQMGGSITTDEIFSRLPDGVDRVYIKTEENRAYWVRGEESGDIKLW